MSFPGLRKKKLIYYKVFVWSLDTFVWQNELNSAEGHKYLNLEAVFSSHVWLLWAFSGTVAHAVSLNLIKKNEYAFLKSLSFYTFIHVFILIQILKTLTVEAQVISLYTWIYMYYLFGLYLCEPFHGHRESFKIV